jgi:hypothetical protein
MVNQFTDITLDCEECEYSWCKQCDPLKFFNLNEENLWLDIGMLVVIILILRIAAGVVLFVHTKRN